jgi:hypothetical protein
MEMALSYTTSMGVALNPPAVGHRSAAPRLRDTPPPAPEPGRDAEPGTARSTPAPRKQPRPSRAPAPSARSPAVVAAGPGPSAWPRRSTWPGANSATCTMIGNCPAAACSKATQHCARHAAADSQSLMLPVGGPRPPRRSNDGQAIFRTARADPILCADLVLLVGATGFEPVTPRL